MPLADRLFRDDVHHLAGFSDEIRRVLPAAGRALDLGCGQNTDLQEHRTRDREVWGADFQPHPELAHRDWFRPLTPTGAIPFDDGAFRLVTTRMVMEHVDRPAEFWGEIERVLEPGGYYIGHTISGLHYVTGVRRLFDLVPERWTQSLVRRLYGRAEHDTFPTRYRLNTPRQVARSADPCGFDLVRVRRYACQGYFRFSRALLNGAALVDWAMDGVAPGMGRLYFTVVLRKRSSTVKAMKAA